MFNLSKVIPEITKYRKMKIFGSGQSIKKYDIKNVQDELSFYVVLNHVDVIDGLDQMNNAPILFFAHDFHGAKFDPVLSKKVVQPFLKRSNVFTFLHNKVTNHENEVSTVDYSKDRLSWIKNIQYYEISQSNLKHFENTTNSLLGFSSTLHSALSLTLNNKFIEEVSLYGMDLYIYQQTKRFDGADIGDHATIIFNANKFLLNYINKKRKNLKISFFN